MKEWRFTIPFSIIQMNPNDGLHKEIKRRVSKLGINSSGVTVTENKDDRCFDVVVYGIRNKKLSKSLRIAQRMEKIKNSGISY